MVIDGSLGEGVEDTEKLLANQHSSALLPFHEQQLNEQKKYYYDVSGKIEFKSYVEHQSVGQEAVKQLIRMPSYWKLNICTWIWLKIRCLQPAFPGEKKILTRS